MWVQTLKSARVPEPALTTLPPSDDVWYVSQTPRLFSTQTPSLRCSGTCELQNARQGQHPQSLLLFSASSRQTACVVCIDASSFGDWSFVHKECGWKLNDLVTTRYLTWQGTSANVGLLPSTHLPKVTIRLCCQTHLCVQSLLQG